MSIFAVLKKSLIILLFLSRASFAQIDSIATKAMDQSGTHNPLKSGFSQIDSTKTTVFDSLNAIASFQWVKDSLTLEAWSSKMKTGIQSKFNTDSLQLKNKIDSLSALRLPTIHYEGKLDSLRAKKGNMLNEVSSKQQELLNKTQQNISAWKQRVRTRLDSLGFKGNLPNANLPNTNLPNTGIPNANLPGMPDLNMPALDLPQMPSLSATDFSDMDLSPDVSKINADLPFSTPEGFAGIQENLTGIKKKFSGLKELKSNPDKAIEQAVGKMDGVKELEQLKDVTNPMEQLPANNPDAVKEELKKQAINHFAGKEEVLQSAMSEISKYKKKYSSVQSLKDLKKNPPNPMKGKPFIERFVPGLLLHIQKRNDWSVDFNPYAGYRLTGKLITGAGWNQRWAYNFTHNNVYGVKVYGPRLYAEYDLFKGFQPRIEFELMRTYVTTFNVNENISSREWVRTLFLGFNKKYKISRHIKGTSSLMYNLFDVHHKSPYGDKLVVRLGLEAVLKKKVK